MGLVALWHGGSSRTRAQTHVPCIGRRILNHCATREVLKSRFLKIRFCHLQPRVLTAPSSTRSLVLHQHSITEESQELCEVFYCPSFTDDQNEAHRQQMTYPQSHKLGSKHKSAWPLKPMSPFKVSSCFAKSLLSVLRFVGFVDKITTRFTQINSFNQFFNERWFNLILIYNL